MIRKAEGEHVEVLGLVGIILNCIFRKWDGETFWVDLTQYRDR